MSLTLRIALIVGSLIAVAIVARGVRKEHIRISESVFWILSALLLLVLAVFPQIAFWCSSLLGFLSPSNFVFVIVIFLLLVKLFGLSCDVSRLSYKVDQLTQEQALETRQKKDDTAAASGMTSLK